MCQGSVEKWVAWKQQNYARGTWFLKMYLWGRLGKECIIWLYSHNSRHGFSHNPCHLALLWKPFLWSTPFLMWSLKCCLSSFLILLTHFNAVNICRKPEGLPLCGIFPLCSEMRGRRNSSCSHSKQPYSLGRQWPFSFCWADFYPMGLLITEAGQKETQQYQYEITQMRIGIFHRLKNTSTHNPIYQQPLVFPFTMSITWGKLQVHVGLEECAHYVLYN